MLDLGNIIVTAEGCANPYGGRGLMGDERAAALGRFLRGLYTAGLIFWNAPAHGGAHKLESGDGLVRAEEVDFYWNADGTPKVRARGVD